MRDNDLDYVRAIVPIGRIESVAGLDGIGAVNLDEMIQLGDPTPEVSDGTLQVNPPGSGTPFLNPYLPTQDIGAPQSVALHPTFDGRGVKIAIIDSGVHLLTPELQSAKLLDGTPARKIIN